MRVPFIVRLEKLWQDRDQVQVAVLYKPGSKLGPLATGKTPWNHSVEITQGSSCGSHHGEATPAVPPAILRDGVPSVLDPQALAAGDLVMSTALDNSNHDCNLVLQAESLVIAKEHVIDEYGPVSYTFGNGCSGGSLSQMQVANAYPGIYQGLVVSCTFPDPSTPTTDVYDCDLFSHYWSATGIPWSTAEQDAADGKESPAVCNSWLNQDRVLPGAAADVGDPERVQGRRDRHAELRGASATGLRPGEQPARGPLRPIRLHGQHPRKVSDNWLREPPDRKRRGRIRPAGARSGNDLSSTVR
jgi:hypothetical protein